MAAQTRQSSLWDDVSIEVWEDAHGGFKESVFLGCLVLNAGVGIPRSELASDQTRDCRVHLSAAWLMVAQGAPFTDLIDFNEAFTSGRASFHRRQIRLGKIECKCKFNGRKSECKIPKDSELLIVRVYRSSAALSWAEWEWDSQALGSVAVLILEWVDLYRKKGR